MAFKAKNWKDAPSGWSAGDPVPADATPIDAAALVNVETRLAGYTDQEVATRALLAHSHAQSDVTNLVADLAAKAPLASPALTGTPTAPTPAAGTNTTQLATMAAVQTAVAPPALNIQTVSYTLVLSDAGKIVEMTSALATTLTVPANASVAFPVGTLIEIARMGAGTVTIAAATGVTIRSRGGLLSISAQYESVGLRKRATDEWVLSGALA